MRRAPRAEMHGYAAAARRQRGTLLSGERGQAEVSAADGFFQAEGCRAPERMAAALVAGFDR